MKPRQLQYLLSELDGFEKPDIRLEQYATSPELAAAIVNFISDTVDCSEGILAADLGCGCGMLSIALAAWIPTCSVVGVDIDESALETCKTNVESSDLEESVQLLQADVLRASKILKPIFDIVIMNPPFGTKNNSGLDMKFVEAGLSILRPGGHLFSLHKSSTRDFVLKTGNKMERIKAECCAQLRWELPATYKFHKKKAVDIDVDLIQFTKE